MSKGYLYKLHEVVTKSVQFALLCTKVFWKITTPRVLRNYCYMREFYFLPWSFYAVNKQWHK